MINPRENEFIVSELSWDRIFLNIYVKSLAEDAVFYFIDEKQNCENIPIEIESYSEGIYHLRINICQAHGRSFLDNGIWKIKAINDDKDFFVKASIQVIKNFDSLSRIFNYKIGKSYNVSFDFREEEEGLVFLLSSFFMTVNEGWRKRNGLKGKAVNFAKKAFNIYSSLKGKKGILFLSQTKNELSGNLLAVYEKALEKKLDKEYPISVYARAEAGGKLKISNLISLGRIISEKKIIFVDDYTPIFSLIDPPKRTQLIQLWHAGVGFKSVGYSRFGKNGSPHPIESCHRKYTTAIAPGEGAIDVYREVFAIEKEAFKPLGMARLDNFLNNDIIDEFKSDFYNKFPSLKNKKLILFAPTYRGKGQREAYYDYNKLDFPMFKEKLSGEYALLLKMHPFVKEKPEILSEYAGFIIDVSEYDINKLYYVSDILVTDYSSCYYEYAILERPILFYTYDREVYALTRGVHKDVIEDAPGKVCDSFRQLVKAIEEKDFQIEKTLEFKKNQFTNLKGNSAEEILDGVLKAGGNNE